MAISVTVFTPTYNRAYILKNVFDSLMNQTCKDFEWLVVDDGSTDNTEVLIEDLKGLSSFPISYYKTENGGKHRATNFAAEKANGYLIFVVDSDDVLSKDAIEKILYYDRSIKEKSRFAGVFLSRGDIKHFKNSVTSFEPTNEYIDKTYYEKNAYDLTSGEKADALYTDVLRRYKYPDIAGEKFMSEGVIYNRMAKDGLLIRWAKDIIYYYEYLPDGLTSNSFYNFLNNPKGYFLYLKESKRNRNWLERIKFYYSFYCDLYNKYSINEIAEITGKSRLFICVLSLGKRIKGKK